MGDTLTFTILGCGSSGGVPRIGNVWGACDPLEPRNRRRRCALLVQRQGEAGETSLLIDAGPDLREQLIDTPLQHVDGVIITHPHADHCHGLDDLRQLALMMERRVDVHADEHTLAQLRHKFGYCFETPPDSNYPPIIQAHRLTAGRPMQVQGAGGAIAVTPFEVDHGDITALGLRIGALAYVPDVRDFPSSAIALLAELDVLIIDALRKKPHPSHLSLDEALGWIARLEPKRAILTNMHIDMDYRTLKAQLPPHVEPAYDGMSFGIGLDKNVP